MSKEVVVQTTEVVKLDKKQALESALMRLFQEHPFYGTLLQQINIRYSNEVPTASIRYDNKRDNFVMDLNYDFFAAKPIAERKGILQHEILHFAHQHMWRATALFTTLEKRKQEQFLFNMAGDMAINQYISDPIDGWVDVKKFKTKKGSAFPEFRGMEEYYRLLNETDSEEEKKKAESKGEKTPNQGELSKYGNPGDGGTDIHDWDELDEESKQKMLEEAKKLIQRTMEKTSYSASQLPGHIKDLLEELDTQIAGINYKKILRDTIKKTIACADRESTWNRPSKRYGVYSPGTKTGKIANIAFMADSSGSISYTEMSEFLNVCDGFLKVGQKTAKLGLWHTNLYKVMKYKNANSLTQQDIQSGGTDVTEALAYVDRHKPDLTIVLTDGYLNDSNGYKTNSNILWVISKNGTTEHPYRHIGKTIKIK